MKEKTETEVSNFFLTNEVKNVHAGMMIALPPTTVEDLPKDEPGGVGKRTFSSGARTADLARYPKHRHGPKKPKQPLSQRPIPTSLSTAKLLEEKRLRTKQ